VDVMLSETRDMAAARAFFRSAKTVAGITPVRATTDGYDSYPREIRTELGRHVRHWASKVDTDQCAGSSAVDQRRGSDEAMMTSAISSALAHPIIDLFPPITADCTLSAPPQRR
jgi:hypothetical protein